MKAWAIMCRCGCEKQMKDKFGAAAIFFEKEDAEDQLDVPGQGPGELAEIEISVVRNTS